MGVTRGDHHRLGRLLRREAAPVHFRAAPERPALIDGAACLKGHVAGIKPSATALDFYHGSEHVNEAARQTLGTSADGKASEPARLWAGEVLHALRHEGYGPFREKLCQWRGRQRGRKRAAADGLLHFVAPRWNRCAKRPPNGSRGRACGGTWTTPRP